MSYLLALLIVVGVGEYVYREGPPSVPARIRLFLQAQEALRY